MRERLNCRVDGCEQLGVAAYRFPPDDGDVMGVCGLHLVPLARRADVQWIFKPLGADCATTDTLSTVGRPATGKAPMRSLRVPDDLWNAAMEKANERGESLSEVIRKALERYVKRP